MSSIKTYTDIDIELYESQSITVVQKQGDEDSRFIRIRLIDNTGEEVSLDGVVATFIMSTSKKAGVSISSIEEDSNVTIENNRVVIKLDTNMLSDAGLAEAEVSLTDTANETTLSSTKFYIYIEPSVTYTTLKASDDYRTLTNIVKYAQESQSWAIGGTHSREGEDTDNAKYWSDQAKLTLTGLYKFKGSVQSRAELPTDAIRGDVYDIISEGGMNVAWTGSEWDELGSTIDLSGYQKKLTAGSGININQTNNTISTNISTATQKDNGLMSSTDKTKLDGLDGSKYLSLVNNQYNAGLKTIKTLNVSGVYPKEDTEETESQLTMSADTVRIESSNPLEVEAKIDMQSNRIINCADPEDDQDVATKWYVDESGSKDKAVYGHKDLIPYGDIAFNTSMAELESFVQSRWGYDYVKSGTSVIIWIHAFSIPVGGFNKCFKYKLPFKFKKGAAMIINQTLGNYGGNHEFGENNIESEWHTGSNGSRISGTRFSGEGTSYNYIYSTNMIYVHTASEYSLGTLMDDRGYSGDDIVSVCRRRQYTIMVMGEIDEEI